MSTPVRLENLAQAREALQKLQTTGAGTPSRGMTLHQVLLHCAQSIDYSLRGFPRMKPKFVRATVGRIVVGRFLSAGRMNHNLAAPVPGAPAIPEQGELGRAWAALYEALDRFEKHEGPLHEHFIFGALSKEAFGRLHAMHIADHLSAF